MKTDTERAEPLDLGRFTFKDTVKIVKNIITAELWWSLILGNEDLPDQSKQKIERLIVAYWQKACSEYVSVEDFSAFHADLIEYFLALNEAPGFINQKAYGNFLVWAEDRAVKLMAAIIGARNPQIDLGLSGKVLNLNHTVRSIASMQGANLPG